MMMENTKTCMVVERYKDMLIVSNTILTQFSATVPVVFITLY